MFADNTVIPIASLSKEETKRATQCYHCGKPKGSGKMFKCKGCKMAAYCCRAHQKADFKKHTRQCKQSQRAKQANRAGMKFSKSLIEQFQETIRAYTEAHVPPSAFDKPDQVFRATRVGDNFHIHTFSMREFYITTKLLIPNQKNRKEFETLALKQLKEGQVAFVVFSSQTKAHAICFNRKL